MGRKVARKEKTEKQLLALLSCADSSAGWSLPRSAAAARDNLIREYFALLVVFVTDRARAVLLCSSFIPGLIPAGSFWGTFWWWSGESSQTASPPMPHIGTFYLHQNFHCCSQPPIYLRTTFQTRSRAERHIWNLVWKVQTATFNAVNNEMQHSEYFAFQKWLIEFDALNHMIRARNDRALC